MDLSRGLTFQSYSSLSEEKKEDQRVEVPSALLKTYSGLITTEARRQCTVAMPISVNAVRKKNTGLPTCRFGNKSLELQQWRAQVIITTIIFFASER